MSLKQSVLKLGQSTGLFDATRKATSGHLRILGYHGLWVTPGLAYGGCTFIEPEQFASRMQRLKRSGYPVLPLGEAVERLAEGSLPDAAVVITIDDGWASTFTHMLPVLEALELPATLYATTWYSGRDLPVVNVAVAYLCSAAGRSAEDAASAIAHIEQLPVGDRLAALEQLGDALGIGRAWLDTRQFHLMSPAEIGEAKRRGLDIQLHTHRHVHVGREIDRLAAEIEENRAFLAQATGLNGVDFCYPSGDFHPDAPAILAAVGIRSATLVAEGLNAPGADPYTLRRLLDGRRVSDIEFDAYLAGALHFSAPISRLLAA
jgi:peptidoglycan/xylan/chitin deacetylase (PgdA/CDA1 family)